MSYTGTQLAALKAILDAPHPVSGAWAVDDGDATKQANAVNRPGKADAESARAYALSTLFRGSIIYGRVAYVARRSVGDTWLAGPSDNVTLTLEHIAAALTFVSAIDGERGVDFAAVAGSVDALALGAGNAHCMGPGNKDALVGFSDNRQSILAENDLPAARGNDITRARALP
jgi:hypothetical protein